MNFLLPVLIFIFTICNCVSQNLVLNSNFETNGQLNCNDWYDGCQQALTYLCDTLQPGNPCDIQFVKDAPPGGGIWSLDATGVGNSFPTTASTYITGIDGTHFFLLKAWMKDPGPAFGGVTIGVHSKGKYELHKSIPTNGIDWTFYSAKDTLTLEPTDSIQISLSAFAAGPSFGDIYFDQVEYILLDSLTSVPAILQPEGNMVSIYPNPATDEITLDIADPNQEHTISFYSITGQLVRTLVTPDEHVIVDLKNFGNGVFFYNIERVKDRQRIGNGKFVVE